MTSTATTIEDEARALIRRGVPIVICDGKVPLGGKAWHTKPVTEHNLAGLLHQAANPAIGLKLGDYIDIEADSPDEEKLVSKLFEGCEPPITPTFKSTRGKHRIYLAHERLRNLGRAVVNFTNGNGAKLGIRIGANGMAAQSVIPPSPGREWVVSWDDVEPAALPDVVVTRIVAAANPQSTSKPGKASGGVVDRARKYLATIPPAVSGQGGHDATFHAACVLVCGFSLDRVAALELLHEWNQSCEPPWADWELEHKVDDAFAQPGERGYLLHGGAERGADTTRHTTDVGNAERFAAQHGADVRYCHPWGKWLTWDGRRWGIDDSGEVMRRAKQTARSIYVEASKASDKQERETLAKWAAASERRERLTAMIALAESEQPIPIAVETLDAEPWLLNCENGTLDLRTGELREHRREDCLTKLCPVEYPTEPGIDANLWVDFLNRIFDGNTRLIGFLQRLVGMSLVGEVLENILAIFYGSGANGKSVFLETICGILGTDYAMVASTSLLMVDRMGRHPTERTDLHGRRFVAAIETGDGGRLSEETVKQLTSREAIRARRMREDFWEFQPSHSVILATNHKPEVRGTDYGIWRRLRLVPFGVVIPEAERDKELANKLKGEWPAILRWAVTGCLDWQRNGLQAPDEVLEATDDYRADMDVLGEYLEERCIIGAACEARAADLYRSYKAWAEKRGEYVATQTKFGTRLAERGFSKLRDGGNRVIYRGVGLLPEGPDSSEGFSL